LGYPKDAHRSQREVKAERKKKWKKKGNVVGKGASFGRVKTREGNQYLVSKIGEICVPRGREGIVRRDLSRTLDFQEKEDKEEVQKLASSLLRVHTTGRPQGKGRVEKVGERGTDEIIFNNRKSHEVGEEGVFLKHEKKNKTLRRRGKERKRQEKDDSRT